MPSLVCRSIPRRNSARLSSRHLARAAGRTVARSVALPVAGWRSGLRLALGVAGLLWAGTAWSIGPETHLDFTLLHEETVGGAPSVVSDANPGLDDTVRVEDEVFLNAVHGTHRVHLVAEVGAQQNGAPTLRALGEHEYHLTGTNRQSDVWTLVDGDQLLRSTLVDELTIQGLPLGSYTVEFYWDLQGDDDVLIDLDPGNSLYAFLNTRVRLEARNAADSDAYEENVPWPSGYRDTDLDQTKTLEEYVMVSLPGSAGQPLAVETRFEVEPDTRLDNFVELPGTALRVDGGHWARFDQSAELIGIVVRDAANVIRPLVTVTSASGFAYPVLDAVPVAPLPQQTILSPVAVVGNTLGEFSASVPAVRMIDHSGLDKPFTSGVTNFDRYFDFSPTPFAQANFANNWQSLVQTTLPVTGTLDFDLGAPLWIDRLAIWNRSLERIRVQIATSPTGPWQELGAYTLQNRLFYTFSYPVEILDLGGEHQARYVRIQIDSAYKARSTDTFAYGNVGEVAFRGSPTPVPEPASTTLAAAGLVGLLVLAGRKRGPGGMRTNGRRSGPVVD